MNSYSPHGIVWKYKYSHYNSFTPQLLLTYKTYDVMSNVSIAVSLIQYINLVKKTHFILHHMF